jgi:ceroid-lipofuscinosis MFS transporter 7
MFPYHRQSETGAVEPQQEQQPLPPPWDRPSVTITTDARDPFNEASANYLSMEHSTSLDDLAAAAANNDDEDNGSMAPSIASSVITADGIHDYPGFVCVCFVILIGDMSRGVFFPSLWPLVQNLGGSEVLLGYAVASFSFGRILVNPLFGAWSHSIGYTKTLLLSCTILWIGTACYTQIQNVGQPAFLVITQTILGIGSGTLGVTRAFVADVTARRNRTTYMAWITAVQYGGFTVTPLFGALFNQVLGDADYKIFGGILRLNMYTAPAFFMSAIVVSTIVILILFFRDRQRYHVESEDKKKKSQKRQTIEDVANSITKLGITVYDCCILGCMLLNVATKGSIACFETLGIAMAQEFFAMRPSTAGFTIAACGVLGVIALLQMGHLEQRFTDVQIITAGILIMILGIVSLSQIENNNDEENGGYQNPGWLYAMAMVLIYAIGYPIGHTAVIGMFSKST